MFCKIIANFYIKIGGEKHRLGLSLDVWNIDYKILKLKVNNFKCICDLLLLC
jgi:hypothetical protein